MNRKSAGLKKTSEYYRDESGRCWVKRSIEGRDLWRRVKRTPFEIFMTGRARSTPPKNARRISSDRIPVLNTVDARPVMFGFLRITRRTT